MIKKATGLLLPGFLKLSSFAGLQKASLNHRSYQLIFYKPLDYSPE
jgi:hypothetical protein